MMDKSTFVALIDQKSNMLFTIDIGDFGYAEGENNKGAEGYLKVF